MVVRLLIALVALLVLPMPAAPQLFTPIVTKTFESAFTGTPAPFFNQTAATAYDFGGQAIAYNVPSPGCSGASCAAGSTSYRADPVNFKTSTFGTGFPYQLGFNTSPNSYCYTISITQAGPYVVTLWLGDTSSGGSWSVNIDGQKVGTVSTPVTGNFSTLSPANSGSFNATLGTHIMCLAWASGDSFFGAAGDIVAWQGSQAASGVACSIGPNFTGSLPPGLPAGWGCAANWDFQSAAYSNVSTWLGCGVAGTSFNTTPGFQWYHDTFAQQAVSELPPCTVSIVNDNGITALKMSWAGSSYDGTFKSLVINTYTHNNTNITDFPNGAYYEFITRLSTNSLTAPTGTDNGGIWTWTTAGTGVTTIENDFELFDPAASPGGRFTQFINYVNAACGNPCYSGAINYSADMAVYHKIGVRVTTDGSTRIVGCTYLDGAFQGCLDVNSPNAGDFIGRHAPIMQIGAVPVNMDFYIQYLRVWSCSNWATQQCNGAILTGP